VNEDAIQQLVKMIARNNELTQEMLQKMDDFRAEMNERFERLEDRLDSISTTVRLVNRYTSDLKLEVDALKESGGK
jgi:predicted nuclease with TOPRIM domain